MKRYTVTFLPDNVSVPVEAGASLLSAQILAGLHPDAPCGGKGTCGKCGFKNVCGGCRARSAYYHDGDVMAEDSYCVYGQKVLKQRTDS